MPELPEVETVRRSLQPLEGRKIQGVYLSRLAPVETTTARQIRMAMEGARVEQLDRWGKYLLLDTDRSESLVIHLGMTGQLFFYEDAVPSKPLHTHLEFSFEDSTLLRFIDARRFGTLSLTDRQRQHNPFLARLGPDYLAKALTPQLFVEQCRRHPKLTLKMLLLNQSVATGLGNIYACEALYLAELDPRRRVTKTSDGELTRLLEASKDRLKLGVLHGGTTFRDYLNGLGHRGKMQDFLQVYDRAGQRTLDGRGEVIKIVQQGRSTFFCPGVQK